PGVLLDGAPTVVSAGPAVVSAVLRLLGRTRRGSVDGPGPLGGRLAALSPFCSGRDSRISRVFVLVSLPTPDTGPGPSSGGSGGRMAGIGWTRCAGISTIAVVPPYGEGLSVTFTP